MRVAHRGSFGPRAEGTGCAEADLRHRHYATRLHSAVFYSTVTDLARLRGLSMSRPRDKAVW